jgi:hypothetical protein
VGGAAGHRMAGAGDTGRGGGPARVRVVERRGPVSPAVAQGRRTPAAPVRGTAGRPATADPRGAAHPPPGSVPATAPSTPGRSTPSRGPPPPGAVGAPWSTPGRGWRSASHVPRCSAAGRRATAHAERRAAVGRGPVAASMAPRGRSPAGRAGRAAPRRRRRVGPSMRPPGARLRRARVVAAGLVRRASRRSHRLALRRPRAWRYPRRRNGTKSWCSGVGCIPPACHGRAPAATVTHPGPLRCPNSCY